jgi:hypothetical protein
MKNRAEIEWPPRAPLGEPWSSLRFFGPHAPILALAMYYGWSWVLWLYVGVGALLGVIAALGYAIERSERAERELYASSYEYRRRVWAEEGTPYEQRTRLAIERGERWTPKTSS